MLLEGETGAPDGDGWGHHHLAGELLLPLRDGGKTEQQTSKEWQQQQQQSQQQPQQQRQVRKRRWGEKAVDSSRVIGSLSKLLRLLPKPKAAAAAAAAAPRGRRVGPLAAEGHSSSTPDAAAELQSAATRAAAPSAAPAAARSAAVGAAAHDGQGRERKRRRHGADGSRAAAAVAEKTAADAAAAATTQSSAAAAAAAESGGGPIADAAVTAKDDARAPEAAVEKRWRNELLQRGGKGWNEKELVFPLPAVGAPAGRPWPVSPFDYYWTYEEDVAAEAAAARLTPQQQGRLLQQQRRTPVELLELQTTAFAAAAPAAAKKRNNMQLATAAPPSSVAAMLMHGKDGGSSSSKIVAMQRLQQRGPSAAALLLQDLQPSEEVDAAAAAEVRVADAEVSCQPSSYDSETDEEEEEREPVGGAAEAHCGGQGPHIHLRRGKEKKEGNRRGSCRISGNSSSNTPLEVAAAEAALEWETTTSASAAPAAAAGDHPMKKAASAGSAGGARCGSRSSIIRVAPVGFASYSYVLPENAAAAPPLPPRAPSRSTAKSLPSSDTAAAAATGAAAASAAAKALAGDRRSAAAEAAAAGVAAGEASYMEAILAAGQRAFHQQRCMQWDGTRLAAAYGVPPSMFRLLNERLLQQQLLPLVHAGEDDAWPPQRPSSASAAADSAAAASAAAGADPSGGEKKGGGFHYRKQQLQLRSLLHYMASYVDICYCHEDCGNTAAVRQIAALHAAAHIYKARTRVLQHSSLIEKKLAACKDKDSRVALLRKLKQQQQQAYDHAVATAAALYPDRTGAAAVAGGRRRRLLRRRRAAASAAVAGEGGEAAEQTGRAVRKEATPDPVAAVAAAVAAPAGEERETAAAQQGEHAAAEEGGTAGGRGAAGQRGGHDTATEEAAAAEGKEVAAAKAAEREDTSYAATKGHDAEKEEDKVGELNKAEEEEKTEEETPRELEDWFEQQMRDNGCTRPRVLLLAPFRSAAKEIVEALLRFIPHAQQVLNRRRFEDEFGISAAEAAEQQQRFVLGGKPADYISLFEGNDDDCFRLGIRISKKAAILFAPFAAADIIVASPLGLRTVVGAQGERKRDYDFLSSIELVIVDRADVISLQNWTFLKECFAVLNLPPATYTSFDIRRLRPAAIAGVAAADRQTVLLSSGRDARYLSLFKSCCCNRRGLLHLFDPALASRVASVFPVPGSDKSSSRKQQQQQEQQQQKQHQGQRQNKKKIKQGKKKQQQEQQQQKFQEGGEAGYGGEGGVEDEDQLGGEDDEIMPVRSKKKKRSRFSLQEEEKEEEEEMEAATAAGEEQRQQRHPKEETKQKQQKQLLYKSLEEIMGKDIVSQCTAAGVQQLFCRIHCSSVASSSEALIRHLIVRVLPTFSGGFSRGALLVLPSYLEYCRLWKALKDKNVDYVRCHEYTSNANIMKARQKFQKGEVPLLVTTVRFLFFRRYRLSGGERVIFVGPPASPEVYGHVLLCSLRDAAGARCGGYSSGQTSQNHKATSQKKTQQVTHKSGASICFFTKYHAYQLERLMGVDKAKALTSAPETKIVAVK